MEHLGINVNVKNVPELDPKYIPLHKFNAAFLEGAKKPLGIAVERAGGEVAVLLDWRVSKVWRNRDFYFLFEGKESYILLPRRAFGSAEEEKQFERLVLVANPGVAWRNFG